MKRLGLPLALLLLAGQAYAQTRPFGAGPIAAVPTSGFFGWIFAQQAAFYRELAKALLAVRSGQGMAGLIGISFIYGIFHAAGPGHGKAVISAYIVARGEDIKKGLTLSALSSLAQALTAIIGVSLAVLVLGLTAKAMNQSLRWIEIVAFGSIVLIGLRLLISKSRAFSTRYRAWKGGTAVAVLGCDDSCVHLPEPQQLARITDWKELTGLVLSVGLRPCSGAILVLVFAYAQNIPAAGIWATFAMALGTMITVSAIAVLSSGLKSLAVRFAAPRPGLVTVLLSLAEVLAALLVIALGLGLMFGYLASENLL